MNEQSFNINLLPPSYIEKKLYVKQKRPHVNLTSNEILFLSIIKSYIYIYIVPEMKHIKIRSTNFEILVIRTVSLKFVKPFECTGKSNSYSVITFAITN